VTERDRTREYSERLGAISDEQLQRALDHFDLGALIAAEPATTGLFGQNIFLSTTAGEFVLRGAPYPDWQLAKERFFTNLIHEHTDIPAPWPFDLDDSAEIFGWPYAIMPRLPGLDIGNPAVREHLTADERCALAHAMGEALACLHAPTWPHCGEYDPELDDIRPLVMTPAQWAVERAHWWLDHARAASAATTDADVAWVEELLASVRNALEVPFWPALVHHDYKENNAVAERTADGWRITGLFDVGGAFFADGEEDLCRSIATYAREDEELAREIVAGYRERRDFRPGFEDRFRAYMLMDRLVIWEYGQRNNVWFASGMCLRDYAEPFTQLKPW